MTTVSFQQPSDRSKWEIPKKQVTLAAQEHTTESGGSQRLCQMDAVVSLTLHMAGLSKAVRTKPLRGCENAVVVTSAVVARKTALG